MAEGWGPTPGNAAVTDLLTDYPWIKLHIDPPGAAGTANPAVETTRQEITGIGTATGGSVSATNQPQWTNVSGSEDYTHLTLWSASTAGTFGASGLVTANPVTAGDTFTLTAVTASVTLAS